MISFEGKNVLVTGGSRGIGAAIVKMFSKLGANIAFNYNKNLHAAEKLAQEAKRFGAEIFFDECDVRDLREVDSFCTRAIRTLGSIDILVNNAGIWEYAPIDKMTIDDWRRTIQTNLDGVFYFTRHIVRHMLENQIQGNIIHISLNLI